MDGLPAILVLLVQQRGLLAQQVLHHREVSPGRGVVEGKVLLVHLLAPLALLLLALHCLAVEEKLGLVVVVRFVTCECESQITQL